MTKPFSIEKVRYLKHKPETGESKPHIKNVKKFNIPNTGYFYFSIWINDDHYRSPIKGAEFGAGKFNKKLEHHSKKAFIGFVKRQHEKEIRGNKRKH